MITGLNGAPRINVAAGQSYATGLLPNDEFILELAVALMEEIQFASCYPSIRRDAITRAQRGTGDSRTPSITPIAWCCMTVEHVNLRLSSNKIRIQPLEQVDTIICKAYLILQYCCDKILAHLKWLIDTNLF